VRKHHRIVVAGLALAGAAFAAVPTVGQATTTQSAIPHYQHIVEIMMENTSYATIIGNPLAPQINALADTYGLATDYFGVTHPSEPNYVANVAGSFFGIQDDNQFYCTPALAGTDPTCAGTTVNHTINAQSIADQLSAAGQTWRGYFQGLPPTPSSYVSSGPSANGPYTYKYPSNSVALYASKHNPFINFVGSQGDVANMVPDTQLASDLASGDLANYSLVVPDQCHDMHGTGGCSSTNGLIAAGDSYVGSTVSAIMASHVWQEGNNAIVITWDEDDFSDSGLVGTGCCGADPGGGHVVTIVITNKGAIHVTDATADNHHSLLKSMEAAFGLPFLAHAGDASVPEMVSLFHPSRN
jgi:phosphatidylinositol-3-phosphatase